MLEALDEAEGARRRRGAVGWRTVAGLSWPIAVQMLSYTAMGLVDTLFVGWFGTDALAAVGMGAVCAHLVSSGGIGLLSGTRVAVSQHHGAQRGAAARDAAWAGLRLAAGLGLVVPLAVPLLGPSLALLGAEGAVFDGAVAWTRIRVFAVPFLFTTVALSAWCQGRGDTRTPMIATLVANAANIVLDPLLAFGLGPIPGAGPEGTAAATVAGTALGLLVLAVRVRAGLGPAAAVTWAPVREVLHFGAPIGLRHVLEVGSFSAFVALLASVGPVAMAAHLVVIRVVSVSFLPGHAIGEACSVLVGQAVGAHDPLKARSAWRTAMALAVGVMGSSSVVFLLVPGWLLAPFGLEPEVLSVAVSLMAVAAAFQVVDAVAMVGLGALNGAGETRVAMVLGVAAAWLVKLPLGWLFVRVYHLGAAGAWWGLMVEIAVVAVVVAWWVERSAWAAAPQSKPVVEAA